jgi:hypothetical protein
MLDAQERILRQPKVARMGHGGLFFLAIWLWTAEVQTSTPATL